MNRRRFFALSLPALLGGTATAALAQKPPIPKPRRIKIEVSLLAPDLTLGKTNARILTVETDEGVETFASFLRMYTFKANAADQTVASQAYGPSLRVTPKIEPDGRIALTGGWQFEEAVSPVAAPNQPLPTTSTSAKLTHTVESGKALALGGLVMNGVQTTIQVTATLLPLPQAVRR